MLFLNSLRFQIYRFSQSPIITFATVVYSIFVLLFVALKFSLIPAIIVSVLAFFVIFIPLVSLIYPVLFTLYTVAALILSGPKSGIHFYILAVILVLNIARFGFMIVFSLKNPNESREFDYILRRK